MLTAQSFEAADLGVVAFLVVLEALLSADNALVLAVMVRHLPKEQQKRALLYGLGGAFVFRLIAILLAASIIRLWWLQAIGALYLLVVPFRHFAGAARGVHAARPKGAGLWPTVVAVETADIAFAMDSVLAAVSTVGDRPEKLWVVYLGAVIGVVLLRFAANAFIRLLDRYPLLDHLAYAIVGWVGVKLAMMALANFGRAYTDRGAPPPLGFEVPEMPTPIFWGVLLAIAAIGGALAFKNQAAPRPEGADPQEAETGSL